MLPWSADLAGRLDHHVIDSHALRGNPLGDPHERPLWVYVPPGYDDDIRRYPTVYVIQGYTGHITMWNNRTAFRRPFPELADQGFATGDAPPAIIVYVDAWTSYGGSQFLNSPGIGQYHTYLCDEVVAWVDAHYRTIPTRDMRAITGKSSGGYGSMVTAMLRPEVFGALATHAGDALFETCYAPEFPISARALRDLYGGSYDAFLADFRCRIPLTKPDDELLIETYGYAAAYSADDDGTVHASHLDRRRHPGRVLPRPRRDRVPPGRPGRRNAQGAGPLRVVRRRARGHRVPISARALLAVPATRLLTAAEPTSNSHGHHPRLGSAAVCLIGPSGFLLAVIPAALLIAANITARRPSAVRTE